MSMQEMYLISRDELHIAVKIAVLEALQEFEKRKPSKEYSLNQVSKMFHMSWSTIRNLVREGKLKTTGSGRITEKSMREFLNQQ